MTELLGAGEQHARQVEPERLWPSSRWITNSNLVVRGHSGPTQQHRTGLGCAGSGCAPLFATQKQLEVAGVALSSLPWSRLSPLRELH